MIVLTVVLIVGIILCIKGWDWDTEVIGGVITALVGIMWVIAVFAKVINPIEVRASIAQFESTRTTVAIARHNGTDLEDVMLQKEIIDCNCWLASQKYYNSTIWGWWIPDEVEEIEPIK